LKPNKTKEAIMQNNHHYLITGATGNVGKRVAEQLLSQGHQVRVFGRSGERLQPLVDMGAAPFVGDMLDKESVNEAFRGVDAALLIAQGNRSSHDYRRDFARAGENYAAALTSHGVKWAVFISSLGADDDRNRGVVLIHADVERALNAVPELNVVHLRAPLFFEDLYFYLFPMRQFGVLTWPISTQTCVDMGSTRDVADIAVDYLRKLEFHGRQVADLHGEAGVNLEKIAELISKAVGRTIPAKPASREADIEGMVAAGMGRDFSNLLNDGWDTLSRGLARREKPDVSINLHRKIEDFIRDELTPAILSANVEKC
jgi:uncharacterized protein YbjT (DUF2867 family)